MNGPLTCHVLLEARSSPSPFDDDRDGLRLFSKCRNELLRVPAFLDHYRRLGVDHFFVVDNGSTDGTLEYLTEQSDVVVFSTTGRFREARGGTDWLNALLRRFGVGHWCVTVDIDEFLRYPGSEQADLRRFTDYLDAKGSQALGCLLLDMYPDVPLSEVAYTSGADPLDAAPYFDTGPYKRYPYNQCPGYTTYGGVRERLFYPESWDEHLPRKLHVKLYHRVLPSIPGVRDLGIVRDHRPHFAPCLTKVPLVRWERGTEYLNVNHFVSDRRVAAETGVLTHFKLLQDFHARAVEEVERAQYYDGATEFRRYVERLEEQPRLVLTDASSARFECDQQLERLGLMTDTPAWASARARASA